jgi:putative DNA primase/helicase
MFSVHSKPNGQNQTADSQIRTSSGRWSRHTAYVVADIEREADLISDEKTRSKVRAFAKGSGNKARLAAMINLAGAEAGISCQSTDFDNVPGLLPVLNGVIDLSSGELLAHDPNRLITRLVKHKFVGGHSGARFENVLDRILPDKSVQTFVQRLFGYALHGNPVEQRFALFQGRGANGKSVLFDTIGEVVREWVVKTSSSTFLQKDTESTTRPDLVRLQGSRIVIGGETPSRRKLDATTVKALTGDREVTARPLYLEDVTFRLSFVPFMVSNPLPPGDEEDRALWRRLLLIPFNVVIPEEERDPHLVETLVKDESEAVLAWLVQGAIDYAQHGLAIPEVVKESTAEWRRKVGSIERFLLETWQPEQPPKDSHRIGLSLLHDEYQRWCYSRSIHPKGIESFRTRADELGYQFKDTAEGETIFGVRGRKPVQAIASSQGRA